MNYTYTNYKDQVIDPLRFLNSGDNLTVRNSLNRAAKNVLNEIDLRTTKRNAVLSSDIFDNIYDYTCPTDLKELVDFQPQINRGTDTKLVLTTEEQFDRKKTIYSNYVCIANDDGTRKIRASMDVLDTKLTVSTMDSLTDSGSWALFGDAENVTIDTDNYVSGGGSMNFDISSAGGTTAGVQNSTMTQFDIEPYTSTGSAFVWAYITSTTDLTNYILRIGNSASNYYSMTVTTAHDGNAFANGWNLLRFDFSGKSTTGTVTEDEGDYVVLYMTKAAGKVSETDYRFDDLQLHTGQIYYAVYYSLYPWQSSTGTWKVDSTADTDYLNAESDEYNLFIQMGKVEVFKDLKEFDLMKIAQNDYLLAKQEYCRRYPSERLKFQFKY